MLAHRIPYPPHTGDKVRAYHVARYLARRHELTLGFLVDDPSDRDGIDALRRVVPDLEYARTWKPWSIGKGLAALTAGGSLTLPYFHSGRLGKQLRRRRAGSAFDLIYASSSPMAQYADGTGLPLVMDFVDVDSDKWIQYAGHSRPPRSWLYRIEGRRLQEYEAKVSRRAGCCLLATEAEEALLRSFAPWARTAVIPNGVDLAYYQAAQPESRPPAVIFTGAMDYLPNVDAVTYFCDSVLPLVRQTLPGTVFYIVGLNPAPAVMRMGSRDGVVVTGAVPDVRPYYAQASVCVAPLRMGRGVQNKVLQAMALGMPVVASPVAARGLLAVPGTDLHVEGDPEGFASRVVGLLQDPAAARALGQRGRALVEAHYSWDTSFSRLEEVIQSAVRDRTVVTPA